MPGFEISRETEAKLRQYEALLLKWQKNINLISTNTIPDIWHRHFLDSLQLLPLIPESVKTLYDLGSGAGFAGMVLAISRPDLKTTLIESDSKKCAFLSTVSRETNTNVIIQNERIEQAVKIPPPELITARALASLSQLLEWTYPWLVQNPKIILLFPKGEQWQEEILTAEKSGWLFHMKQVVSATNTQSRIFIVSDISKK